MIKIIELPIEAHPLQIETMLASYEYLQSYPMEYKAEEGYVKVIRYIVKTKENKAPKKASK
jgi:hypothetical protein